MTFLYINNKNAVKLDPMFLNEMRYSKLLARETYLESERLHKQPVPWNSLGNYRRSSNILFIKKQCEFLERKRKALKKIFKLCQRVIALCPAGNGFEYCINNLNLHFDKYLSSITLNVHSNKWDNFIENIVANLFVEVKKKDGQERSYAYKHYKMWDFIVDEIMKAFTENRPVPSVLDLKLKYLTSHVDVRKRILNFCFACEFVQGNCDKCPLSITSCKRDDSQYKALEHVCNTFEYNKALGSAIDIRDGWKNYLVKK